MNHPILPLNRIYRLKVIIVALASLMVGVGLLALAKYIEGRAAWEWLAFWPVGEIGGTLAAAGMFGIAWDFVDARDKEARENERIRRLLKESAPEFRDAVVAGFVETPENMRAVATDQTLDRLAANALALRLHDRQFGAEIYENIRDQAIGASERWYDARVKILLGIPRSDTVGVAPPLFDVVVRWEYTLTPAHQLRHFTVVSDPRRYNQLAAEAGATSTWFKSPIPGIAVTDPRVFTLDQFTLNGRELPIERTADDLEQTYTVDIGSKVMLERKPVTIAFTYTTVTTQAGHLLHFDLDRPTRGLEVELDFAGAGVASMRAIDYISSTATASVAELPSSTNQQLISLRYHDWILPRAGVAFVWTLDTESSGDKHSRAHHAKAA